MRFPDWMQRRRLTLPLSIAAFSTLALLLANAAEPPLNRTLAQRNWLPDPKPVKKPPKPSTCPAIQDPDPLMGPRTRMPGRWKGLTGVPKDLPIVVMAGHADSQGMSSAGTPGFFVDKQGLDPMEKGIRDELFWNLQVQKSIVKQGLIRGLNIRAYNPPSYTIRNDAHPDTNWSKAKLWSARGDYILEIHFDAYQPHGFGSGLIPVLPNVRELNVVDESLAQAFGRFPRNFRGGLGGPRRGIGILEIGMLEPPLETKLRNPDTRKETVDCLALRVVDALQAGVDKR